MSKKLIILVIGGRYSGKTTYVNLLTTGNYNPDQIASQDIEVSIEPNISGVDFRFVTVNNREQIQYALKNHRIDGVFCFFDVCDPSSVTKARDQINIIPSALPKILCGTKLDLATRDRSIISDKHIRNVLGNNPYVKMSSRRSQNIHMPLHRIIEDIGI